jgi:hypothetical protein
MHVTPKSVTHCKEISTYVFPEKELRGLSPNFHIHVSASDLYFPSFGPPIFHQQNRQTDQGNLSVAHRNMNMNWDCSRAVPFLGIFVSNFRYCVFAVHTLSLTNSTLKKLRVNTYL